MRLFERETAKFQRMFIKQLEDIRSSRLMLEFLYEQADSTTAPPFDENCPNLDPGFGPA